MPRAKSVPEPAAKRQERRDWFLQTGVRPDYSLATWDIDAQKFVNFLFDLMAADEFITLRPGQGGLSLGVQVWTWENKRPYVWVATQEDFDNWVKETHEQLKKRESIDPTP